MRTQLIIIALMLTTLIYSQRLEVEGDVDVKGNKISSVANPTVGRDAATKAYVDMLEAIIKSVVVII